MQKTRPLPTRSDRLIETLKNFSVWHRGLGVVLLVSLLALLTRTIDLSSFPYFQPNWPWQPWNVPPPLVNGLYADEYNISLVTPWNSVYFPFLQVVFMDLVINALGYSIFSIRFASALFSSTTCILVYLTAHELFNRRLPAFLSSLFFILMTPALVYGRMAFVENGAATFFVAAFLFALKYHKTSKERWLIFSGISAALSFLCKQTGLAALVFLILFVFIYEPKAVRKLPRTLIIAGLIASAYFVQILLVDPSYLGNVVNASVGIGELSWLAIFLFNLMPSGVNLMWIEPSLNKYKDLFRFATLDFWYIIALFVIVYLTLYERKAVSEVILAISSYILVLILVGHANSYYAILVQPFMAIPFGYGVLKLRKMPTMFSAAFAVLLCYPAISYINYYVSSFLIKSTVNIAWIAAHLILTLAITVALFARIRRNRIEKTKLSVDVRILLMYYAAWAVFGTYLLAAYSLNPILMILQFTIAVPILVVAIMRAIYERVSEKDATVTNNFFILFYILCLIIGSYLLPVFYPGYFAQSSILV